MGVNNKDLVEKADTLLADLTGGGLLNPDQSTSFIEKVIASAHLLGLVRTETMDANKGVLDKTGFGSTLLQKPVD